jgi:hypothetical protein
LRERIDALDQQRQTLRKQHASVHHMNSADTGERAPGERECSPHEQSERDDCSCGELIKEHNIREPEEEPLWGITRERLRLQLARDVFTTWLHDVRALRADTHLIAIVCPSEPQAQFLKLRLHDRIQRELEAVLGAEIAVTYIVAAPAHALEEAAA